MYKSITNGSYIRPPNGTRIEEPKHPSRGGNPYPAEIRQMVISMWQNEDDLEEPRLVQLRHQKKFPSLATCRRWIHQYATEGNVLPKRNSGNRFATREVHGQDIVNLALYWMCRPKAYVDEVRAYVHNRNIANPPYSRSQIYRAEQRLGLYRKAASTTSDLAYSAANLHKREQYWSHAFPDGVDGVSTRDVIDLDESGYKLDTQNRSFGKVTRDKRCDARGKYKKGDGGVSLLMAISGDERPGQAFSFHRTFTEGGTDLWRFYNFMLELCDWLTEHRPGHSYLFTMDNLNIHTHTVILNLIYFRGHRIVFRAPYWSCDGAIEYVFNTLQTRLQIDQIGVENEYGLVNKINNIIGSIPSFKRYFIHVGFPDN
jgi:hypothetical protein